MILIMITKEYKNSIDSYAVTRRENCHTEVDKLVFDLAMKWGEATIDNIKGFKLGGK